MRPRVTAVPPNTILVRSPRGTVPSRLRVSFRTGSLSPVREASATVSAAASTSRPSPLTASPSLRISASPGTAGSEGTRTSALASWVKPSRALPTTMTATTIVPRGTPWAPSMIQAASEIAIATSGRYTNGLANWASSLLHAGTRGICCKRFGPVVLRRSVASAVVRPVGTSVLSSRATTSKSLSQAELPAEIWSFMVSRDVGRRQSQPIRRKCHLKTKTATTMITIASG